MVLKLQAPVRLDLACGQRVAEGFIGVDMVATEGATFTCDLSQTPWKLYDAKHRPADNLGQPLINMGQKLEDESVDEVRCSHFFEHLDGFERIRFMEELWRVLKHHGKVHIIVPYGMSTRAVQDPTHKWPPVVESSFLYFYQPWLRANGLDHYLGRCNFWFTYEPLTDDEWQLRNLDARNFGLKHYINVVSDLHVFLTKIGEDETEEDVPPELKPKK